MATAKELTPIVAKLVKDLEHLQIENSQLFKNVQAQQKDINRINRRIDEKAAEIEVLNRKFKEKKPIEDPINIQVKNVMSAETILNGLKEEIVPINKRMRAAEVYKQYKLKQEKI